MLIEQEDADVTRQVLERFGGWDALRGAFARPYDERRPTFDAVYDLRERIRRTYDAQFLRWLTPEQLGAFNEHLRNTQILLVDEKGRRSVAGVGR